MWGLLCYEQPPLWKTSDPNIKSWTLQLKGKVVVLGEGPSESNQEILLLFVCLTYSGNNLIYITNGFSPASQQWWISYTTDCFLIPGPMLFTARLCVPRRSSVRNANTLPGLSARWLWTIKDVSGFILSPAFCPFSFFLFSFSFNRQGDLPWIKCKLKWSPEDAVGSPSPPASPWNSFSGNRNHVI